MGFAVKDCCNLVIKEMGNSSDQGTTIDYLNTFNIKTESETFEAKKKGNVAVTFSGSRKGTIDMGAEVIDDSYLAWMLGGTITGTKIQVKGTMPNKYYTMEGTFTCVSESGEEIVKSLKFAKCKPNPNADLTLSATEISSFSLNWSIMVDDADLIMEVDNKTA